MTSLPHGLERPATLVNIQGITDDAKCDELVRRRRGPDGVGWADVKQKTIGPLVGANMTPGSVVCTDEHDI